MGNAKLLRRYLKFFALVTLLAAAPHAVSAQEPRTITGAGTFDGFRAVVTITFPPSGGAVTGTGVYRGDLVEFAPGGATTVACPGETAFSLSGTFAGGDGGVASGTWSAEIKHECVHGTLTGSWTGSFLANGTGSGTMHFEANGAQSPWQVTFSPQEFQSALAPPVTSEYIYNTYGIKVEDSFGDDKWAPKAWSAQELVLLNDVLKELPPGLLKKLSVTSIIRNQTALDAKGNPDPRTFGLYSPCERTQPQHGCHPSSDAVIRVFDSAFDPRKFSNDPTGYKAFKATILHELTHALQRPPQEDTGMAVADPLSRNRSGYVSPLMQNYNDATRIITDINDPAFRYDNGWGTRLDGTWVLVSAPGNTAPTAYAETNPKEDMAEAVKLYVYDPQRLLNSSAQRYNFVRDQIFGGVEYEDGHQK